MLHISTIGLTVLLMAVPFVSLVPDTRLREKRKALVMILSTFILRLILLFISGTEQQAKDDMLENLTRGTAVCPTVMIPDSSSGLPLTVFVTNPDPRYNVQGVRFQIRQNNNLVSSSFFGPKRYKCRRHYPVPQRNPAY